MTKPYFSVSHLALHSCGHHHPAWQPPPPSPRGAWSPTSFPRGVTTSFFSLSAHQSNQPLLSHHCFPPITDFKGWQQSKSTHNMRVSWPACTSGDEHRTDHRAPAWPKFRAVLRSLWSTLTKISGSARYAALARLRSLLKPQKRGISFILICPLNIGFSRFFPRCTLYESQ